MAKRLSQGRRIKDVCEALIMVGIGWGMLAAAASRVSLTVTPQVCLAPCRIEVRVRAPSHPPGSRLLLEVDGPAYYAGEERPISDDGISVIPVVPFRDIPAGDYTVTAALAAGGKVVASATTFVSVGGQDD